MSHPEDDDQAPADPSRTVFNPGGSVPPAGDASPVAPAAPPPPPSNEGADHGATVFMPSLPPTGAASPPPPPPEPAPLTGSDAVWDAVMPPAAPYAAPPAVDPPPQEGRIAVGSVLNHIYEVKRFLARGGMGEVYEGFNVNTDEKVAIKVILSHLAMDPAVQAMFRKEARTLTRLSHPGLVQYRVLAQEPNLGVLYIVTEFIDGAQLSDVIGKIQPGADELEGLVRRLAAGLGAAHALGAIHRDISPDNVLLPDGRLDQAKVIDFGIAKDLDASSKTIVGDGFAGKLGFVAPEQFGDFDRQIGPWTDVYSLALVVLAVANGRDVDMGATLVDAIDKRRKGPDLTPIPERLRPVIEGMLKPNPLDRFRSMEDVLEALDGASGGRGGARTAPPAPPPPPGAKPAAAKGGKSSMPLIAAGIAGVVLLALVGGAVVLFSGKKAAAPAGGGAVVAAAADSTRDSEKVRKAVEGSLSGVTCSWLDIVDVNDGSGGVSLRLAGVAGSPVDAQQAVTKAAQSTGAKVGLVDTSNVFPVGQSTCAALDAFRAFREPNSETGRRLISQQSNWELMEKNPPCVGPNAKVVVDLNPGSAANFTVLGFDRKGGLQQIFADRAALDAFKQQQPELVTDKGGGGYSTTSCYNETGLVGEAMITGAGPFDVDLPSALQTDKSKVVDPAWLKAFTDKAKAGGWKTNMVWYRVVNDQPG